MNIGFNRNKKVFTETFLGSMNIGYNGNKRELYINAPGKHEY
jgi:hypothetical protein